MNHQQYVVVSNMSNLTCFTVLSINLIPIKYLIPSQVALLGFLWRPSIRLHKKGTIFSRRFGLICFYEHCSCHIKKHMQSGNQQVGVSKNRGTWKRMVYSGNPIKMDDLEVPLFLEIPKYLLNTSIHFHVSICLPFAACSEKNNKTASICVFFWVSHQQHLLCFSIHHPSCFPSSFTSSKFPCHVFSH